VRQALEQHQVPGELLLIGDGDRAIRYLEALLFDAAPHPDLVILDLNLPKRSGREVLQFLRQSASCGRVEVVVLSCSDAPQDRAESIALGASQYLCKPLLLDEFLRLGAVFKAILEKA
jgi:two-component system response regulator